MLYTTVPLGLCFGYVLNSPCFGMPLNVVWVILFVVEKSGISNKIKNNKMVLIQVLGRGSDFGDHSHNVT